jgi:thioredoxin-like negative regulator of GroEL
MNEWNSQNTQTNVATFSDDPVVIRVLRFYRLRLVVLVLALAAFAYFGVRPAYHKFRQSQINRNLEEARIASRLEDWGVARDRARSVLIARPGDFDALRIWFKALAEMGEQRTYLVAIQIFVSPQATRQDRLDSLEVMVRQAPQAVALGAFGSLTEEERQSTEVRAIIAPLFVGRGEVELAEKMLRAAPELESNADARLELLRVLCTVPTVERVAEAREIFAALVGEDTSKPALDALIILGEAPGGLAAGSPLPNLKEWVAGQPAATTLHHLLALHPLIDEAGDAADPIFEDAISRFIEVDPGVLGSWLLRHDQTERVAKLMEEPALSSGAAFIPYLQALLRQKDTIRIATALGNAPPSVDLVDLHLAKALVARLRQDSSAEIQAWNESLRLAAFDPSRNRFIEIGRHAETIGAANVIEDSWVAAVLMGWGKIPLYRDLLQVFGSLAAKGRSRDLLSMYRTLLRFEPRNPDLLNNFYYLALLHGVVSPAGAVKALKELGEAHPDRFEFRSALAMALLMNDQPDEALEQVPWMVKSERISPMMRLAIGGTAMILTGNTEEGKAQLAEVQWPLFLRIESLAFRNLLTALEIKDLPLPDMAELQSPDDPENAPAWRAAVERISRERANDTLPALPAPRIPGVEDP